MGERLEVLVERYENAPVDAPPRRNPSSAAPPAQLPAAEQLVTLRNQLVAVTEDLERRVAAAEARAAVAEAKADAATSRVADVLRATELMSDAVTGSTDVNAPPRASWTKRTPKARSHPAAADSQETGS